MNILSSFRLSHDRIQTDNHSMRRKTHILSLRRKLHGHIFQKCPSSIPYLHHRVDSHAIYTLGLQLLKAMVNTLFGCMPCSSAYTSNNSNAPSKKGKESLEAEIIFSFLEAEYISSDFHLDKNHFWKSQSQVSEAIDITNTEDIVRIPNCFSASRRRSPLSSSITDSDTTASCKQNYKGVISGLLNDVRHFRATGKSFNWWWILMLFISGSDCMMPTSAQEDRTSGNSTMICESKRISNSVDNLRQLTGCRVIEGNLQIVLIESLEDMSAEWKNYSFPLLVEITGFLTVYRVDGLRSLGDLFPNLSVIRGMQLQKYYALVIYYALHLENIGLHSLTSIMRGSVRIQNNYNLCYVENIDWAAITEREVTYNVFKNNNEDTCGPCNSAKNCWSANHPQRTCKSECGNRSCSNNGECCHKQCVGGCHKPENPSECFACRNVSFSNVCLQKCVQKHFKYLGYRCVNDRECIEMRDHRLYEPPGGESECVLECPFGYQKGNGTYAGRPGVPMCIKCAGICNKTCLSQYINSIEKAQSLHGCTVIDGPLIISITGGKNISKKLKESLKFVREVKDYVRVFSCNSLMSLDFLSSLITIGGRKLYIDEYALYIHDNANLETIWDWNAHENLTITEVKAKVRFHSNPKLCYENIEELLNMTGRQSEEVNLMKLTNGNKIACQIMDQNVKLTPMKNRGVINITWHAAFITDDDRMLTGYYVYYKPSMNNESYLAGRDACDDDWNKKYVEITKNDTWIIRYLKGLDPATRYVVYVETDTVVDSDTGARARSNIANTTTLPYNPDSPRNLKVLTRGQNSVMMSWSPPRHANGDINHYVIRVTPSPVPNKNGCSDIPSPNTVLEDTRKEKDVVNSTVSSPTVNVDNETDSQQNTKRKCCACPQEDTRRHQLQRDITFEDALYNSVYTGLTLRQERDTSEENIHMYKQSDENSDLDVDVPEISEPNATDYIKPEHFKLTDASKGYRRESTNNTTITVSELTHFTRYLVEVVACHLPVRKLTLDLGGKEEVLCSLHPATKMFITREIPDANKVTNIDVVDGMEPGVKTISWDPPKQPNGEIIAYIVVLQPQTPQSHWSSKRKPSCVSVEDFEERNNTFEINESDFDPGVYTLLIRPYTNPPPTYSNESYRYDKPVEFEPIAGASVSTTNLTALGVVFTFFILLASLVGVVLFKTVSRKSEGFETWNEHYNSESWSQKVHNMFASEHILQMHDLQLETDNQLGHGNFGVVVPGKLNVNSTFISIAAKSNSQAKDEILSEAKLMLKLDCYHLVKANGVAAGASQVYLVMEYMSKGDLLRYVRSLLNPTDNDISCVLTYEQICGMAVQIADGMSYLASIKIVHRDLAARNCLVDDQNNIKISDFGMSRLMGNDYYKNDKTNCFPVRWLPPEYLTHERFTSQSDVWSYGVVVWEILSGGARPYKHLSETEVLDMVKQGHTLESELPVNTPDFLTTVVTNCWRFCDRSRPYFPQIISALFSYTSPNFQQHFRMVSFYYSGAGQDYKRKVETLQDGEAESDVPMPMTTTPSSYGISEDSQPPPLPSQPFWGLKWLPSLSFREPPSASRAPQYPLDATVPSNAPERSPNAEANQEFSWRSPVPIHNEPNIAAADDTGLTNSNISLDFKPAAMSVQHHSSVSDLSTYSESQPRHRTDISKSLGVPANNIIVNINRQGAPSSSLTSPRSLTKAAIGRVSKSFINFRSTSSPNIKPAAC